MLAGQKKINPTTHAGQGESPAGTEQGTQSTQSDEHRAELCFRKITQRSINGT